MEYYRNIALRTAEKLSSEMSGQLIKACLGLLGIMLLIYLITELTPYAAKLADKLLGGVFRDKDPEDGKDTPGQEYKVYDIYEGDKNFKDDDGGAPGTQS